MARAYYSADIGQFLADSEDSIIGVLSRSSSFDVTPNQIKAWEEQIKIVKDAVEPYHNKGKVYFEYEIPRLGGRIDVVLLIEGVVFIIEFKVGAETFLQNDIDQVEDYALDLKNFHETSHNKTLFPILVATEAESKPYVIKETSQQDKLLATINTNIEDLPEVIAKVLSFATAEEKIKPIDWEEGRYSPTPTIIEAATTLYRTHSVEEISSSSAGAINLRKTSERLSAIIEHSKNNSRKSICFVTGVPGAGKTLVGLNIATKHLDPKDKLYSVFLSGNGPLVNVLREALARDKTRTEKERGNPNARIGEARSEVKSFIQNVHNFRDDCIANKDVPPIEHVALFDEAQRAWDLRQTENFMKRRKGLPDFGFSEPEFLISCLDRHVDWATIVCLVGGGQEINTGEAGISEWFSAIEKKFSEWDIYVSPKLDDSEYSVATPISKLKTVSDEKDLHLSVSMRSFRAEKLSLLVKQILDLEVENAKLTLEDIKEKYPIVLTRDLNTAKKWLREKARGSERYGMMVSSRAARLKPHAIDLRPKIDPVHWFLEGKNDTRSSYYLEDVVTEFDVQGLEVDWGCVTWDADFRYEKDGWQHRSFKKGKEWQHVIKEELQNYQKNAYRVLLTRARQGMVIVIPQGDPNDHTRAESFYDPTFEYLQQIGFTTI